MLAYSNIPRPPLSASDEKAIDAADGYHYLGLPKEAMEELDRCSGEHPAEHILRGRILASQKNWAALVERAFQASTRFPDENELVVQQVLALNQTGQTKMAVGVLSEARTWMRTQGIVAYNLACYEALYGSKERAVIYLDTAIETNPTLAKQAQNDPETREWFVRKVKK